MAHEAEPSPVDDDTMSLGLLDVTSMTAAAVLASSDWALGAALRRIAAELGDSAAVLAAFGNFAPPSPGPS